MQDTVNYNGRLVWYEVAVQYMDEDIREELHTELAPCTEQEFFDAYVTAHSEKYDEDFVAKYENDFIYAD